MKHKKHALFILRALLMTAMAVFFAPNTAFSAIVGVGAQIGNDNITNGTLGTSYSAWIAASGSAPFNWKLESGSLPNGLQWAVDNNSYGGGRINITGTPNMPGIFTFRFYVWNWVSANYNVTTARKDFTIVVQGPSKITTSSLPDGTEGVLYNQALSAHGPVSNWAIDAGALPDGLQLNSNGVIFGTPTAAGTFSFSVQTTNAWASDAKVLTITIDSAAVPPGTPTITTSSLPGGTAGTAYSQALDATGTMPITWSLDSGNLPDGLDINATTGVISGTPTADGTFSFTVGATNTAGSDAKALSIVIAPASDAPTITTLSLPVGITGTAYSQALSATGTAPITWSLDNGNLPDGLDINATTGVISGTPTTNGTFNFTVRATNTAGSDTKAMSVVIASTTGAPTITTLSLPGGSPGAEYSQTLGAAGTTPITWALDSGNLPDGLDINATTGVISGIPTTNGTFNFTVRATNADGSDAKALSIVIASPSGAPTIITSSLPEGTAGTTYSQMLNAAGTTPITWSLESGTLPDGLGINETTGLISGTPITEGTFDFTIKATNAIGNDTKAFSITVNAEENGEGYSGGGGGGCYAGFGILPMSVLACIAIMSAKRKR